MKITTIVNIPNVPNIITGKITFSGKSKMRRKKYVTSLCPAAIHHLPNDPLTFRYEINFDRIKSIFVDDGAVVHSEMVFLAVVDYQCRFNAIL
jgi:hypothetical protein